MGRPHSTPLVYEFNKENGISTIISTTTTNSTTDVCFLRSKIKITPLEKKKYYKEEIRELRQEFESFAKKMFRNIDGYDNNYIFTFSITEDSIKYTKSSFVRYDVVLKSEEKKTLLEHKNYLEDICNKLDEKIISILDKVSLEIVKIGKEKNVNSSNA